MAIAVLSIEEAHVVGAQVHAPTTLFSGESDYSALYRSGRKHTATFPNMKSFQCGSYLRMASLMPHVVGSNKRCTVEIYNTCLLFSLTTLSNAWCSRLQ